MKEYLKMSDYFREKFDGADVMNIHLFADKETAEAAANAINSHDELVGMNKELLDIINRIIDTSRELDVKAVSSTWSDGYKQCAIDTGSSLSDLMEKYKTNGCAK